MSDFATRLVETYNGAALSLMISIGHRTALFDNMAGAGPLTAKQIADKAKLDQRYVREWLGAMTVGRIVAYDPQKSTYELPAEHAAFLTRAATPMNLATASQFIAVLGNVEDKIVDCFKKGGGVPYSCYPRFHEVMAEESDQTIVAGLDENILPLVPGIKDRLAAGIDVLDVGCGRGKAMHRLAKLYPKSRFTGYDFSEEAIAEARKGAPSNLQFVVKDVTRMGDEAKFDLVTAFDSIHDQIDPVSVLAGVRRALRKDGVFLMQDIKGETELEKNYDYPLSPFLFAISTMHCMTVSLSAGGAGLGTMWGRRQALGMLRDAGFGALDVHELPHDIMNFYYVAKPA